MSNNKKLFLITIIIFDFLLIIFCLFFLSQFENFSYKNYNNYKYGFKINYPSYFTVNDNEDTFAQEVVSFIDNQDNIIVSSNYGNNNVYIYNSDNSIFTTLYELSKTDNNTKIDIHIVDEYAFRCSCLNGHLETAKWLCSLTNKYKIIINYNHIKLVR